MLLETFQKSVKERADKLAQETARLSQEQVTGSLTAADVALLKRLITFSTAEATRIQAQQKRLTETKKTLRDLLERSGLDKIELPEGSIALTRRSVATLSPSCLLKNGVSENTLKKCTKTKTSKVFMGAYRDVPSKEEIASWLVHELLKSCEAIRVMGEEN